MTRSLVERHPKRLRPRDSPEIDALPVAVTVSAAVQAQFALAHRHVPTGAPRSATTTRAHTVDVRPP